MTAERKGVSVGTYDDHGGRPVPVKTPDTEFFWDGISAKELRIQKCATCGTLRHPPGPMCPNCGSFEFAYTVSTGLGTVHSFVVHHKPSVPGQETPFVILLVELDEGTRLISNLVPGIPQEDVHVGMRVEVVFHDVDGPLPLPLFARSSESATA
jgi:uncharacterized protein